MGQAQAGGTSYITQDYLGGTRVVTGQAQEVRARYDYLPFGEEIAAGRSNYDNADGTSDSPQKGNYGTNGEAPPGSYKGVWITSRTTGLSLRIYDADDTTQQKMSGPDGTRYVVQAHEGNCSEGCPLIRGDLSIQEVKQQMDALQEQDRKNGKGTEIYVDIEDRNNPTDNFHIPQTDSGTIFITPASPPPAKESRRP